MSIIAWICLGLVAGYIGNKLMTNTSAGLHVDVALGVVGAVVGGYVFRLVGFRGVTGLDLWSLFVAVVGAVIVLTAYRLIAPKLGSSGAHR